MLAIGFPGCKNPPIIWTKGWMIRGRPVMAKSDPKNKIERVANKHARTKPHLWKRREEDDQ
jgi:hypothetical protein